MTKPDDRILALRDNAWNHLLGDAPEFDPRSAIEILDTMDLSEDALQAPEFWEARVLTTLGAAKSARRAQKSLYRLFKTRLARNEDADFVAFQDGLRAAAEKGLNLDGLSFFDSFASLDHAKVWADTKVAINTVQEMIGPTFLNSGTLLGATREKGLIAHDDDVDLAVVLKSTDMEAAADEWIEVYKLLKAKQLTPAAFPRNFATFKIVSESGVKIDLFPAWVEGGRMFIYPHTHGELAEEDVLPLSTCRATGLPIPKKPEAMLLVNYGENWSVPDPHFSFPWGRANRLFKQFFKRLEHNKMLLSKQLES